MTAAPQLVRALTVRQPWAWAITCGAKTVENRTWSTRYRGPLVIHAGARIDLLGFTDPLIWRTAEEQTLAAGLTFPTAQGRVKRLLSAAGHVTGAFTATTTLADVHPDDGQCCTPWAQRSHLIGRPVFHWVLADTRPLPVPLAARGYQGLWTPHLHDLTKVGLAHVETVPDPGGRL